MVRRATCSDGRGPTGQIGGQSPEGTGAEAQAFSFSAAMRFIRPLFLLAAWFLWMTPLEAALSIRLTAARRATSSLSVPTAATAFLVRVRISDFTALLRSRST